MARIKDEAEGGIKSFIAKLKDEKVGKVQINLYEFDFANGSTQFDKVYEGATPKTAPEYQLWPRGATPLYDAVALGITRTREFLKDSKEIKKVVLVVMTDGFENHSREHDFESMTKEIEKAKKDGWQVVFLAGTPEARATALQSGLVGTTMSYTPSLRGSTKSAYASAGAATYAFFVTEGASNLTVPETAPDPADEETKKTVQSRTRRFK